MSDQISPASAIIDTIKAFYGDDNKAVKVVVTIAVAGLLAAAAYTYTNKQECNTVDATSTVEEKEPPQTTAKNKQPKPVEPVDEKREKAIQEIIFELTHKSMMLIVDNKGWNIRYFLSFWSDHKIAKELMAKITCAACNNVCRDCVQIVEETADNADDEITVMCDVCAKAAGKKSKPHKTLRKRILKEVIVLPDPEKPEAIEFSMKTDVLELPNMDSEDQDRAMTIFDTKVFFGALRKALSNKLPALAAEMYDSNIAQQEHAQIATQIGQKRDLVEWKLHDDAATKPQLFIVDKDGRSAVANKRSGTLLFGPFIKATQYDKGAWVPDYTCAGNVYTVKMQLHEADGCGVGFVVPEFGQFIGKNEGQVNSLMLNQTGWFYSSRIFKHAWEPSRECSLGKWFKSEDVLVFEIDCTDSKSVKAVVYNEKNPDNKFEIEKLPKICIAINIIVGSNPTGSKEPGVTILSAAVERKSA